MADLVTQQELFDGQACFNPNDIGLILAFQDLWEKYRPYTDRDEWPTSYYNELSDIASKHGVSYVSPKHLGKLTAVEGVGSTTTVH